MTATEKTLAEVRARILTFPIGHTLRITDISSSNLALGWVKLTGTPNAVATLVRRGCMAACGRHRVWVERKQHYVNIMFYKSTPLLLEEWEAPIERWEDALFGWRGVFPELFTPPYGGTVSVTHTLASFEGGKDEDHI